MIKKIGLVLALSGMVSACVSNAPEPNRTRDELDREAAQYNLQLGVGYLRQGELEMALGKLKKAIEQDPSLAEAHMALGLLYEQVDEPSEAGRYYRKATRLAPENPEILNAHGVFLCKNDQLKDALSTFDKAAAVPLYRTPEAAFTNAGVCARNAGKLDEADHYFRKALARNARYNEALLQMASLNFDRQAFFPARAYLERFLGNHPATPEALWLGLQIERGMTNGAASEGYARRLLDEFPDSAEARRLKERRQHGQ